MLNILFFVQLLVLVLAGVAIPYSAPPDVSNHRNLALLPKSCGNYTISSRIIREDRTGIFEFPWMAILLENGAFKCSGTIINERYILAAAYCVYGVDLVRVGKHNLLTKDDCQNTETGVVCPPPFQDLEVEKIIPHENYDPDIMTNVIGLLRVSRIDLTKENSKPVCLPLAEARTYNFDKAVAPGWGATDDPVTGPELLKVSASYVPLDICQEKWKNFSTGDICNGVVPLEIACKKLQDTVNHMDQNQVCAIGDVIRSSCYGYSPLLVNGTIDGHKKVVQQGIVSFEDPLCGWVQLPGVYTRVAMFMDWILDKLEP